MLMRASQEQRNRTKTEEGLRLEAYDDGIGIWTIGFGHAQTNPRPVRGLRIVYHKDENGSELLDPITHKLMPVMDENGRPVLEFYEGRVKEGVSITQAEADRLFEEDSEETEQGICRLLRVPVEQHQFDALYDFVHQYGLHRLDTSTLLDRLNFNPNSPKVLHEFMRWTRAGGEHREYVWRRSARRCCVYNGTPIPQALWRKNGFPFAVNGEDHVDYAITPTIEKIIDWGKKKSEPPKFDPSKPFPTTPESVGDGMGRPAAPDPEPSPEATAGLPASAGDPQLGQPSAASPVASEELVLKDKVSEKPAAVPAGEAARPGVVIPAPPPTIPKPPPKPIVLDHKSIDVRSIPYGEVDPSRGAKNASDSRRVIGMIIVGIGSIIYIFAARGFISSAVAGIFYDMSRDTTLVALAASGISAIGGWSVIKRGQRVICKGFMEATQLLK